MNRCHHIQKLLPLFILQDGLSIEEENRVQRHLADCPGCRAKLNDLKGLVNTTRELDSDIDRVMETVDWEKNRRQILDKIEWERGQSIAPAPDGLSRWSPRLGLIAASVLLVGIMIGYLLFNPRSGSSVPSPSGSAADSTYSVAVIEENFKKRSIMEYFQQVRFYFLEILEAGQPQPLDPEQNHLLLTQTRYLQNSIENDYALMNAGELLRDIEFVLVEIEQYPSHRSTAMFAFIQDLIKNKRLLLQIHLVSKDIRNIKNGV